VRVHPIASGAGREVQTVSRRRSSRALVAGALGMVLVLGGALLTAGSAGATPPPPPNPSDSDIAGGQHAADAKANEVGRLTNQLAEAEQRLSTLQDDVELKMEQANKARVDLDSARDAADQAQKDADDAKAEADAAAGDIQKAQADVDKFVTGSYQQGSTIGSMSAYMGASSPADMLARAQLLNAVSGSELDALGEMRRAQTEKSNKDADAREKLRVAQQKQADADQARHNADTAQSDAEQAQRDQTAQNGVLQTQKDDAQRQLYQAQATVQGLQGQRQRYDDWVAEKQREEDAQALQAATGGQGRQGGQGSLGGSAAPAGAGVEAVVARALSVVGMPYAWGGGTASGPSRGIHDGGVADMYGDYNKIGFDCSGLMVYAFAGVTRLPHYSGYQYIAGRQVPLSQARRGDMLFWGGPAGIHHVALYLGNGQMVEAPESGMTVRVTSVRYGGIMPYATRLIG
jgi:cell wall-associated NlpC family hydrolase